MLAFIIQSTEILLVIKSEHLILLINQNPETRIATELEVENGWAEEVGEEIPNYLSISDPSIQGYRLAVNAKGRVKTQGFSIGMNYFYLDQ